MTRRDVEPSMDLSSPPGCANTVTVRRNPHRRARPTPLTNAPELPDFQSKKPEISSFPMGDILSIDMTQDAPQPELSTGSDSIPENLKVYLRIRPLLQQKASGNAGDQNPKSRAAKNAWPKNPVQRKLGVEKSTKKKPSTEACITANDPHSVTLSPPAALRDSKRIKSEVYEGFSQVFSPKSSQNEVYEKMVKPLVEEFLRGKSGMLAAMGPTGSGKTHTVFGCPRDPGMVPLLLRQIFKQTEENAAGTLRSFYISMFEICSERGKGERLIDLSPDGTDILMQQSNIRGLREVAVSDITQAESFIACGMLKRTTAMTKANSQSSRSQCIINIRCNGKKSDAEENVHAHGAVLTIVDLAGAEREKRTGNQGLRLAESNFINNTSMVFGLCLRSLLEHQKNPKKPLQKHFQNSMLTRYLRDYLEGKKRMSLILTVRAGEEDYLDASFLLRQASPYMKIKFNNVEELPTSNKRQFQVLPQVEQPKRMKFSDVDASEIEEGKHILDQGQLQEKEAQTKNKVVVGGLGTLEKKSHEAKRERIDQIMQSFAKTIWKVLKQYNKKLQMAEGEVQSLKERLRREEKRSTELEEELKNMKSRCSCSTKDFVDGFSVNSGADLDSDSKSVEPELDGGVELLNLGTKIKTSESNRISVKHPSAVIQNQNTTSEVDDCASTLDVAIKLKENAEASLPSLDGFEHMSHWQDSNLSERPESSSSDLDGLEHTSHQQDSYVSAVTLSSPQSSGDHSVQYNNKKCESILMNQEDPKDVDQTKCQRMEDNCTREDLTGRSSSSCIKGSDENWSQLEPNCLHSEDNKPQSCKEAELSRECNAIDLSQREIGPNTLRKSSNMQKPKRRLLPASSVLKNFSALDVEDESDKPKGNTGTRKQLVNDAKRTQGSISLLRLLQSNLHR